MAKRKSRRSKPAAHRSAATPLTMNHAMIYVRNVPAALRFYADQLGLQVIEQFGNGYARLRAAGDSTIALHQIGEDVHATESPGVRLYFEVRNLESFCDKLEARGVRFKQAPKLMPWGWQHAYLDDPDGHEVSLYWAGAKRLKQSKRK